ncbi:hypothetical protein JVU11DRAFT_10019 [Chiua virens]|nr:hypothetical protein JVU11DRAFT_10019 [Chiua virens]
MRHKWGLHHIKNELVFRSNPNFVFHDSQGFEAGSVEEFDQMKDFVSAAGPLIQMWQFKL